MQEFLNLLTSPRSQDAITARATGHASSVLQQVQLLSAYDHDVANLAIQT